MFKDALRYGKYRILLDISLSLSLSLSLISNSRCLSHMVNNTPYCVFDYNGQGSEYQLLAGPAFIVVFTFAGILVSFVADWYNRKLLLAVCVIFWSLATLLTGFVEKYWQLAVLRFALGLG